MGGSVPGDATSPLGRVPRGERGHAGPAGPSGATVRPARRDVQYCLVSIPLGIATCWVVCWVLGPSLLVSGSVVGTAIGLLGVVLGLRIARWPGGLHRRVAARLLGEQVSGPPPFRRATGSLIVRLDARLRDGPAWRAVGYILLKLPIMFGQYIALAFWVCGTIDLIYPLWWPLFRNAPPAAACSRFPRSLRRRSAALCTPPAGAAACWWPSSARRCC